MVKINFSQTFHEKHCIPCRCSMGRSFTCYSSLGRGTGRGISNAQAAIQVRYEGAWVTMQARFEGMRVAIQVRFEGACCDASEVRRCVDCDSSEVQRRAGGNAGWSLRLRRVLDASEG